MKLFLLVAVGIVFCAQADADWTGKMVSVLGDSVSTFRGYSPEAGLYYPDIGLANENDVSDVSHLWWMQVINRTGATLLRDCAWGSSCISTNNYDCETGSMRLSFLNRAMGGDGAGLGESPDIILVFGGINDDWNHNRLCVNAESNAVDITAGLLTDRTKELFGGLKAVYPSATVYCCVFGPSAPGVAGHDETLGFREAIFAAAAECGVETVDFQYAGLSRGDFDNAAHPTRSGHIKFADCVLAQLDGGAGHAADGWGELGWTNRYTVGATTYAVAAVTNVTREFLWTVPEGVDSIDLLVVGGGGAGGGKYNTTAKDTGFGGGGAGGFNYLESVPVASGMELKIKVGAGGDATTSGSGNGGVSYVSNAVHSVAVLSGGGGAGGTLNAVGSSGASGGGGGGAYSGSNVVVKNGGAANGLGTGFSGGSGGSAKRAGGGGGGAGAAGAQPSYAKGGRGGDGLSCSITGTEVYYAGGGGAGGYCARGGNGGLGGGGAGGHGEPEASGWPSDTKQGLDGVDGLGGGGGGSASENVVMRGGKGGNGIVIIRYAIPAPIDILKPVIGGGASDVAITVTGDKFNVHVTNASELYKYGYKESTTPAGLDSSPVVWLAVEVEKGATEVTLPIPRNPADPAAFYKLVVEGK